MRKTTYVNKNGDEIRHPFYEVNRNNNEMRHCDIWGIVRSTGRRKRDLLVVGDFGNRLYLRRIIQVTEARYTTDPIIQLDDIISVPLTAVTNLW